MESCLEGLRRRAVLVLLLYVHCSLSVVFMCEVWSEFSIWGQALVDILSVATDFQAVVWTVSLAWQRAGIASLHLELLLDAPTRPKFGYHYGSGNNNTSEAIFVCLDLLCEAASCCVYY